MQMRRRQILASAGMSALCVSRRGRAQGVARKLKIATDLPAAHPLSRHLAAAAAEITQESAGRIEMQVYPANQLGSDTDMLSQLRSGALEFMSLPGTILATRLPVASINGVGFIFNDYDQVWAAMDGALGAHIRKAIDSTGLYAFPHMLDNGFRQITSSEKPIHIPADLARLKIRVPVSPVQVSLFTALGAAPTAINFSELYSALQTRIVDGQENPLGVIDAGHLYEVQKHCARSNHIWDGFWLLANARIWNGLPAADRDLITHVFEAAIQAERQEVRDQNASLTASLQARGLQFNDVDTASFRAKLRDAGFYKEWRGKYGDEAWSLLERSVGSLG
jgi:tripartite ATP-independent transporter DctP family solute receptor